MEPKSTGMRRHLYEHLFQQVVERTKEATGRTIMVSAARRLRAGLDEALAAQGRSMDDANLGIQPVLAAIEQTMSGVEGYPRLFADDVSPSNPFYQRAQARFFDEAGFTLTLPGGEKVQPKTGSAGPRLPISPYDPRWAVRRTVKQAGSSMLYILAADVDEFADGDVSRLPRSRSSELHLYSVDEDGRAADAGAAVMLDDLSGLSELMPLMSEQEYRNVRDWVVGVAKNENSNALSLDRYMSAEALGRSTAILQELREQGVGYRVSRDRNPGQIKAEILGTKISVRLTEPRAEESFVGRVYDDGVSTYYSTNHKVANSQRSAPYTPTAQQAVALLRVAQGKAVDRFDGQGAIGGAGVHQESEWDRSAREYGLVDVQDSYYSKNDRSSMYAAGPLLIDGRQPERGAQVFVRRSAKARTTTSKFFATPEAGEDFLRESVSSAREALTAALEVDRLVVEHEEHREAAALGEHFPEFSGDVEVAQIQRAYWDVLRGAQTTLLRPGASQEEYDEKVGVIGELQLDDEAGQATHDMLVGSLAYVGSPEQRVRDHADDVLDGLVGTHEAREVVEADGEAKRLRFDPVRVARFMSSEHGTWRNNADLVAAMRAADLDGDELMGGSFSVTSIKDRLVRFDESSAVGIDDLEDPFVRRMAGVARDAIERNAARVTSLRVDDQGIVDWTAERVSRNGTTEQVAGQIGQIFGRGEHGEIVTGFASGENYLFAPGYEARISAQQPGEDLTVEQRTRLRGYEQVMSERIEYQLANDLLVIRTEVGEPTSLNGVYRDLYDVRHDVDFIERSQEEGLSPEWIGAILETESRRVRYSSEIASGSTVHAAWRAENSANQDPANDNHFNPWVLTGGRNMAIMTEEGDGYFDPVMTNGSVYQGITRYLVEGAEVREDGTIAPGPKDDRAPLMKMPETEMMKYDPYDRQQMSASNLLNASAVTRPVGTAMMTFGGWTADDPMVVSKEFAEEYGIRGKDGATRPLVVGDKLSDLHGNKGVISLIVDRHMDLEEAEAQGIREAVGWFKKNTPLDVVMSPFSAVSRFNGGTARELMEKPMMLDYPFVDEDGSHRDSVVGMGEMTLIVTHKDAESGTRVYDDEALAQGRGRKASSQLAWALGSQGADRVMAEFYGPNSAAATNFREMLVVMGLDMEADGTLRPEQDELQDGAERRLFEMPPLVRTTKGTLNAGRMRADFGTLIGDKGGDLELPFPLKFPTGMQLGKATDASWKLPVLSSHLRSGQDLNDGVRTVHDYTNQYLTIHEMAAKYRYAQETLASEEQLSPARRQSLEAELSSAPHRAQMAFDTITADLKQRRFSGKHNVFKEGLMASRLPNSATAVWTSDPRLDVDQVAMGPAMAEALGFQDDDHALIWRDPVLRDSGVRYLRVKIDERLTGVAINPVMDKCFDGDFDGDSVAVVRLTSEAAQLQASQLLTVEANLLDLGQLGDDGLHPLAMQDSLDVKVTQHVAPEFKDRFEALKMRANEILSDVEAEELDQAEAWEQRHELVGELSTYYREAMGRQYGDAVLRFGDAGDHVKSVIEACIDTGAKGSMAKIKDYQRHIGVEAETFRDLGDTQHTRVEDEGVMMATAVKSHGTGIAGAFSQRGVKALRNAELQAVLELTYPVTQSVLQAKHDPEEAKQKYNMLMGPARALWKGRKLEAVAGKGGEREWAVARDEKGKEVQADVETWKAQFVELYTAKDGLNVSVNLDHVDRVAAALSGPSGLVVDIEETRLAADEQAMGSTMDRLAYGGTFDDVMAAAAKGENIFDGDQNGHFAPFAVRGNQRRIAEWEREQELPEAERSAEPLDVRVLANRDVLAAHDPKARAKGEGSRSPLAATVRAPRPRPVVEFEPAFASESHEADDDYQM